MNEIEKMVHILNFIKPISLYFQKNISKPYGMLKMENFKVDSIET